MQGSLGESRVIPEGRAREKEKVGRSISEVRFVVMGLDPVRRGLHVCEHCRHCGKCSDLLIRSPYSASARPLTRPLARPIFTDFSDFLGRLHPRQTRLQKPPIALGVGESSSPRRALHF